MPLLTEDIDEDDDAGSNAETPRRKNQQRTGSEDIPRPED